MRDENGDGGCAGKKTATVSLSEVTVEGDCRANPIYKDASQFRYLSAYP